MKSLNFVPIREITEIKSIKRRKKISLYTIKTTVSTFTRSKLLSSVKNRNEFNDYDYLHKLNKQELEWLTLFHREYLNSDFKSSKKKLHKTKRLKKNCYDMNNSRNRDIFSYKRVRYMLRYLGDEAFSL